MDDGDKSFLFLLLLLGWECDSRMCLFFFLEWIRNDLLENSLDSIAFGVIVFKESEIKNLYKEIYQIGIATFKI